MQRIKNRQIIIYFLLSIGMYSSCTQNANVNNKEFAMIPLFGDHMVLQQNENVAIWGEAPANEKIHVVASWGQEETTRADQEGKWKLRLQTTSAGGPHSVKISSKDSTLQLNDVMLGEVWLASGQSNMEMPLTGYLPSEPIDNYKQEIANANFPKIRMFTVQRNHSHIPLDTLVGKWSVCSPQEADKFSATAYFFARELHQDLGIPIGIVHSSWGGTEAEAWTSKEGLADFPEWIKEIESFNTTGRDEWVKNFKTVKAPLTLEALRLTDMEDQRLSGFEFDDSSWKKIRLPSKGCHTDLFIPDAENAQDLHGMFWYRKEFVLEDIQDDFKLHTGAIDDADLIYVNGKLIGSDWVWNSDRVYDVPNSLLKVGNNIIAIRHYDSGGGSNVLGPIHLKSSLGKTKNLEGEWSALFYADLINGDLVIYGEEHKDKLKNRPYVSADGPNALASSLYNAMLHPLIPYNVKGAIWYQGESNVGRAKQYEKLFPTMIKDWRSKWDSKFPFYFAQIAPYEYNNNLSPALRDAQRKTLDLEKTGMAILMDLGLEKSIHPGNKQDVGKRLAFLALENDYQKNILPTGPLYSSHTVKDQNIVLSFDFAGDGLVSKNIKISNFEIAAANGNFVPARAEILKDQVKLSSPEIEDPVYARYGWKDFLVPEMFNSEGLPMSSFTTLEDPIK